MKASVSRLREKTSVLWPHLTPALMMFIIVSIFPLCSITPRW